MPNGQVIKIYHDQEYLNAGNTMTYLNLGDYFNTQKLISRTTTTTVGSKSFTETVYFKDLPLDTLLNVSIPDNSLDDISYRNIVNERIQQGLESIPFTETKAFIQKNITYPRYLVPPVFDVPVKTITYDGAQTKDNVIGGKISKIAEQFILENGSPLYRYGAIIEDSIITPKANDTLLNTKYHYSGGWFRNFLVETESSSGAKSKLYYDYSEMANDFDGNPTGKVLRNDNSIETITLTQDRPEYESPIATETQVRKYYPNSGGEPTLDVLKLRTVNERTHHGQLSIVRDPNGWIANTIYDSIGRPLLNRLPFDFPSRSMNKMAKISDECRPVFDYKTIVETKIDTISTADSSKSTYSEGTSTFDTIVGKMSMGNTSQSRKPWEAATTVTQKTSKAVLKVNPPTEVPNDGVPMSLRLKLNFANKDATECKFLTVTVYDPNLLSTINGQPNPEAYTTTQYILNCPELISNSGYTFDSHEEYIELDITEEYWDEVRNGSKLPLEIQLELNNTYGEIEILTDAEDRIPTACFFKGGAMPVNDDFTTSAEYDDANLKVKAFAKIDDAMHTSNPDWSASVSGLDGRYTGGYTVTNYNGTNNTSRSFIGNPFASTSCAITQSIAEIAGNARNVYSSDPIGMVAIAKDSANFSFSKIYDSESKQFLAQSSVRTDTVFSQDTLLYRLVPNFFDSLPTIGFRDKLPLKDTIIDGYLCHVQEPFTYMTAFNGSTMKTVTGEDGKTSRSYYDAYGQLRLTIADLANPDSLYSIFVYDSVGNQIQTITHTADTTKYWYDEYQRLRYKHSPDIGFVSYGYNKYGQLRFSQTAEQSQSNKVSFLQYDDLGRTTVAGEASVDATPAADTLDPATGAPLFDRLTDKLKADSLNIGRPCLPTANPTIWETPAFPVPAADSVFALSDTIPADFFAYPQLAANGKFIWHSIGYLDANNSQATPTDFENIALHPDFVLSAHQYDELPAAAGAVWANMPLENMKKIARHGDFENLLGRQSAIAYRDDASQPFRYVAFSYDARGRVSSLVRFTDNIGYDAVFYQYNSANQIIRTIVSDAEKSNSIWFAYDDNGRLAKVWSRLVKSETDSLECGVGMGDSLHFPVKAFNAGRSQGPDVIYSYDIRGNMILAEMPEADALRYYSYSRRGWLDSLVATRTNGIDTLFMEALQRTPTGRLTQQTYTNATANGQRFRQSYHYGAKNQLTQWTLTDANDSIARFDYSTDAKGNRTRSTEMFFTGDCNDIKYEYDAANPNRLAKIDNQTMGWAKEYGYNANGAVLSISTTGMSEMNEKFNYGASGLVKQYYVEGCETQGEMFWDYQYSGVGGRESKRLTYKPYDIDVIYENSQESNDDTVSQGTNHEPVIKYFGIYARTLNEKVLFGKPHWTYYLRGAGGEELAQYSGVKSLDGSAVALFAEQYSVAGEFIIAPDGEKWYFTYDHQGNVRCKYKKDEAQFFDYTPFGKTLDESYNDANGWIASERDFESRYMNLCFRLYDPIIGRFLSVDPLFEMQIGINPYHYCGNDPVNFSDPSGLDSEEKSGFDDGRGSTEESAIVTRTVTVLGVSWSAFWYRFDALEKYRNIQLYILNSRADESSQIRHHIRMIKPRNSGGGGSGDFRMQRDATSVKKNFSKNTNKMANNSDPNFINKLTPSFETSLLENSSFCAGPFIAYCEGGYEDPAHRDHENGHVLQYFLLGPLYYTCVAIPSVISFTVFGAETHNNMPWETSANTLWYWVTGRKYEQNRRMFYGEKK